MTNSEMVLFILALIVGGVVLIASIIYGVSFICWLWFKVVDSKYKEMKIQDIAKAIWQPVVEFISFS